MIKRINLIAFYVVVGLGLVLGEFPLVYAQEDEFTLEEITVTAEKREENLQDVPIAMETISGYELTEMGNVTFEDALSNIASALVQKTGYGMNVAIRGMSNDQGPGSAISMVAVNVDGAFSDRMETGVSGFLDIERIEVLAGPQGTLYSRNSSGGVVNIITADPVDQYQGSGSIGFGNYNSVDVQGVINAPITEKIAIRGAFSSNTRDGYLSNGTDDNDTKNVRLKLKLTQSDNLSVVVGAENTKIDGKGIGGAVEFVTQPADPWTTTHPSDVYLHRRVWRYYMDLNWDLGFGQLTFLPSLKKLESDWKMLNVSGEGVDESFNMDKQDEKSVELRMISPDDSPIEWIAGLYSYKRDWRMGDGYYEIGSGWCWYVDSTDTSEAAFGNITYPVNDSLRITGGIRHTRDETEDSELHEFWEDPYDFIHNKKKHTDYKLGIEYDISQDSMLWADWSTGYRQGMRNSTDETVNVYQLGSKSRFLDQRAQVNATAYYNNYVGYQAGDMKTWTLSTGDVIMDRGSGNADAIVYGLDLQTNFFITYNDRLDFSASYLHTEMAELVITYDYNPPSTAFEGMSLVNSPEYTITASYEHTFPLNNSSNITAKIETRYQTESRVSFIDTTGVSTNEAHHVSNASLKYGAHDGKWNINFYVKNIENFARKQNYQMGRLFLSAPRTYGSVLSVTLF